MAMNQVAATRRWWRPTPALLRRLSPLSRDAPRSAHRVRRSFASVASVSPSDRDEVPGWLKSPTDPRLQQFLKVLLYAILISSILVYYSNGDATTTLDEHAQLTCARAMSR